MYTYFSSNYTHALTVFDVLSVNYNFFSEIHKFVLWTISYTEYCYNFGADRHMQWLLLRLFLS